MYKMPKARVGNLSKEEKIELNLMIDKITKTNRLIDKDLKLLVNEQDEIKQTLKKQTLTYVLTILGAMAALSWKTVIESSVMHTFKTSKESVKTHFIAAIIITTIVLIIGYIILKFAKVNVSNYSDIL
jgi:hypothetical protein